MGQRMESDWSSRWSAKGLVAVGASHGRGRRSFIGFGDLSILLRQPGGDGGPGGVAPQVDHLVPRPVHQALPQCPVPGRHGQGGAACDTGVFLLVRAGARAGGGGRLGSLVRLRLVELNLVLDFRS